ncbi:hypothetical protein NG895_01965 [Aeoliella sp. ICT_H6.2]|uniref:Uncharacterized protein n=1 Tax=Aeoliella straminimaris TaxID=2954799 RepID=A0A9X2F5K7_9BACT|nr:hypothetical protein [Aeoliella straminimaris]MCO6042662.1 hypothetical protein [Aeoliella straminimaris]
MDSAFHIEIGGEILFRPRAETEIILRYEAERHLREGYSTGTYSDRAKINEILQYQFGYYHAVISTEMEKLASADLLRCILDQYDKATAIEFEAKANALTYDERKYWSEKGPLIRRSLKHIAELVAAKGLKKHQDTPRPSLLLGLETICVCGEMLVHLYILSDQTYGIHPDQTTFKILPEGGEIYWDLAIEHPKQFEDFSRRVTADRNVRDNFLIGKQPNVDTAFQSRILNSICEQELGFSYQTAVDTLVEITDGVQCAPNDFDVPVTSRSSVLDWLRIERGWTAKAAELLLDGFTVLFDRASAEGRQVWKPKREYRPTRRGFLELTHETGHHLAWSRRMARECLLLLRDGTIFQRFPREWRTSSTNRALGQLQNAAGKWFENEVDRNLQRAGILGRASLKKKIGVGDTSIQIPGDIGEIDFLGYLPNEALIIVVECKMVDAGHEPSLIRDDISKFAMGDKCYAEQLRRKFDWVQNNIGPISRSLRTIIPNLPAIEPQRVAGALVTLYPTYASYFIPDFPCVSLSELMTGIQELNKWPYVDGVISISSH